jgi:hypothetical protein
MRIVARGVYVDPSTDLTMQAYLHDLPLGSTSPATARSELVADGVCHYLDFSLFFVTRKREDKDTTNKDFTCKLYAAI